MSEHNTRNRKRTVVFLVIAASVLTIGVVGTGVAKQRGYGCWDGDGHRAGFGPKAIEELGLNAEETAQLESLRDKAMAMRRDGREEFSAVRDAFQVQRNADNPDLRAVIEQARAAMDAHRAERQALIDEGLAFYDTLEPEQQRKAMDMLAKRFGRFAQGGHHGYGKHHRGYDDDRDDDEEDNS